MLLSEHVVFYPRMANVDRRKRWAESLKVLMFAGTETPLCFQLRAATWLAPPRRARQVAWWWRWLHRLWLEHSFISAGIAEQGVCSAAASAGASAPTAGTTQSISLASAIMATGRSVRT